MDCDVVLMIEGDEHMYIGEGRKGQSQATITKRVIHP